MNIDRYVAYDTFASVYDRHWGFFAEGIVPVLDRLVLDDLPDGSHVVDLCCGTGRLARLLTDRFEVSGVDGSSGMIEIAKRNAPEAHFTVADAREFTLDSNAAAVLSTFDSLNHVMTIDDLLKVFARVRVVLEPGARFVFDLNVKDGFEARWQREFSIVDDRDVIVVKSSWDETSLIATADITIIERTEDGTLLRSDLTLKQRCYSESEICRALNEAGFPNVTVFDGNDDLGYGGLGRAFFVAA